MVSSDVVFSVGVSLWGSTSMSPQFSGRRLIRLWQRQIPLQHHCQAAWSALKWSVWPLPRAEYLAQLCYPSESIPAAKVLDDQLWGLLEQVCGFIIAYNGQRGCDGGEITIFSPEDLREGWGIS